MRLGHHALRLNREVWNSRNNSRPALHYNDIIMNAMVTQITSLTIVYSTVYSGADQRKYQSSASRAFVRGIHRLPVNPPHKWPVTWKMLPFDDITMIMHLWYHIHASHIYHIILEKITGIFIWIWNNTFLGITAIYTMPFKNTFPALGTISMALYNS